MLDLLLVTYENGLYHVVSVASHECFTFDSFLDSKAFIDAWYTDMRPAALFAYRVCYTKYQ